MPARWRDWFEQARRDLQHARHSSEAGDHEWACFAAQQAAEKALKAVFQKKNQEVWGHSVTGMAQRLEAAPPVPAEVLDAAKALDKHYIPARYPNGFDSGKPGDYYSAQDSERAIQDAATILNFCENLLR